MHRRLFIIAVVHLILLRAAVAAGDPSSQSFISFQEAEGLALKNSHSIASQEYAVQSAKEDAAAQKVKRYPNFNFDASSTFQSKIGQIVIPQQNVQQQIGDHISWSVGPSLNWVVWDTGQITNKAKSLGMVAEAQNETLDDYSRQVLLNARTAYIGVQLAKEQVRLVTDALKLARAQYADVSEKKNVGTADLLDQTVAHQEVVDREKDLESAQGALGVSKRTLVAALGFDPSEQDPDSIDVEAISNVMRQLLPKATVAVNVEDHPKVKALEDQMIASELAARSSSARHWPKVSAYGTSTFQYPNFGQNTTIQQNQMMLGMHFPILDWGMISKESRSYKYQAYSASEQKKQAAIDLSRDDSAIRERIRTLKQIRVANEKAVKDAVDVARLSYDSYLAGRIIFLDVQRANVKALAVKVDAAQTDAELATQISRLLALAEGEGERR